MPSHKVNNLSRGFGGDKRRKLCHAISPQGKRLERRFKVLHAALFTVRNGCVLAENEHKKENRVVHARVASKLVKNSVTMIAGATIRVHFRSAWSSLRCPSASFGLPRCDFYASVHFRTQSAHFVISRAHAVRYCGCIFLSFRGQLIMSFAFRVVFGARGR